MYRLLVADDEPVIRHALEDLIDWESVGITLVASCRNGVEALDAIVDTAPDIVLTDIKMPGIDGLELIHRIRELDSRIQFIILSGHKEFEFAKQAMQDGVRHYLLKPINENQILEAIEAAKRELERAEEQDAPQEQAAAEGGQQETSLSQEIKRIVAQRIAEPDLSLKWIAENMLYRNVDYLGRCFSQQTGEKFSGYLNKVRVEYSKGLLMQYGAGRVHYVAEQVGFGNNPRYFGQIFKKYTGVTPTQYIEQLKG